MVLETGQKMRALWLWELTSLYQSTKCRSSWVCFELSSVTENSMYELFS